ncbi:MAG: DUF429 domain-containing protein [Deltaproteobacteria bacterium]|nr:DUF429 domain-containing protein [Deltaproteobacteria bacterium]
MGVVFGIRPAPRVGISVVSLYWQAKLPAMSILATTVPSVTSAMSQIIGTVGEWGELSAIAIAAPLTWSGAKHGRRAIDNVLRQNLPRWASRTWVRLPLAQSSAVTVQGTAIALSLANEIRQGQLPHHAVVECNPRYSLAYLWPDFSQSVLEYLRGTKEDQNHIEKLLQQFHDAGVVRYEEDHRPQNAGELEAFAAALTALGVAEPQMGLVVQQHAGGDIRPVGKRVVATLLALP